MFVHMSVIYADSTSHFGLCPSTSASDENIEAGKKIVFKNSRITIREIAEKVGISFESCHAILTDVLGIKTAAAKIVPKLLDFD